MAQQKEPKNLLTWTRDLLRAVDERPYLEGALHELMESLIRAVPTQTVAMVLVDPETERLIPKIARGLSHRFTTSLNRSLGAGAISTALWERETILIDSADDPRISEVRLEHDIAHAVVVPIISTGQAVGYLHADRGEDPPFSREEVVFLETCAHLTGLLLHRYDMADRLRDLEPYDPVTGVLRYPAFIERLEREFQRSITYRHPIGLILIDLEGYGRLLDFSGAEAAGDVLRRVGQAIKSLIRGVDFVGRYGPDEFIVALSDTAPEALPPVAHGIRTTLGKIRVEPFKDGIRIAGGAVCLSELKEMPELDDLLHSLRANLLRARRKGGNRIVVTCFQGGDTTVSEV